MIRVHLAQIFYNQAYYDSPIDYLEEPSFLTETDTPIGRLRSVDQIQSFLLDSKSSYIDHLRTKLTDIARWSGDRGAHILAFPEYSVPFQFLPDMQSLARHYSIVIVAGTHRVTSGDGAKSVYQSLGILSQSAPAGCACAPIFLPDGSVQIATKLKRSKWEPNLTIPNDDPRIINVDCRCTAIQLAVVPCVDSLHPEVLGKLWAKHDNAPDLIVCPSLSPSTDPFHHIGSLAVSKEVLFAYVNTASFGGTFFNLPSNWQPYLKGLSHSVDYLPKNVEAILEVDVDPQNFFAKRGSIENAPICSHPISFPIVYTNGASWLSKFLKLRNDLIEWLTASEQDSAIDWLDSYLADEASSLPDLVVQNLKYLRHSLIPLYDGNIDSIKTATEMVEITSIVEDTQMLWAKRVNSAIQMLGQHLMESAHDSTDVLLECLRSLKDQQRRLPRIPLAGTEKHEPPMPTKLESPVFIGEENLIEAFQNRGHDLDLVRNFFANSENRVIIITGSIGIGKSDFLNWMFRKAFGDWELIKIHIPSEVKVPRIVADIGYKLGLHLDVDSLASASHNVFRQKVRKILTHFYSCSKRALVLDDLQQILKDGNARDHKQLGTFLEEAAAPANFTGGRIFLVSSLWLPDKWFHTKGVSHLRLKGLQDMYSRRVIEYHIRRTNLVDDETIPEPPQALLGIVKGHPLSARLVVDALHGSDLRKLSDELTLSQVTGHIARELLKRVYLSQDEQLIMQKMSVFRLPVRMDMLRRIDGFGLHETQLMGLANRCILSYDGHSFEMHEAVRRFYQAQVFQSELKTNFHHLAALYYQKIYDDQRSHGEKDPSVIAELVHYLALSGEISKAKDLRLLVVEEIKPTARKIYQEYRNYERALSLYTLVADVAPDDPEVLAYIGRCYARLGQWNDSDQAFRRAIDVASRTGYPSWWIYRDWGHIRARFQFYSEAKRHFDKAAAINPNDPSIKASLAYMHWHQGETDEAYNLFEEVIQLYPYHKYTLTFYPKFLDTIGEYNYADILRKRLAELDLDTKYRAPSEYDIEVDYDD